MYARLAPAFLSTLLASALTAQQGPPPKVQWFPAAALADGFLYQKPIRR